MTQTKGTLLDPATSSEGTRECDMHTLLSQIGRGNLLSISGGAVLPNSHGVILPVSNGYKVVIDLMANDTYRVRRIRITGLKVYLYGERTEVYCEEVGQVAYYASCFRSYDANEWPEKA